MRDVKIITVGIERSFADAYGFIADGRNYSAWGGGDPGTPAVPLGGRDWLVQVAGRLIVIRYAVSNALGVLDFQAYPKGESSGDVTPLRLYGNGDGCELEYTRFRRPGESEEAFASSAEWIASDLLRLKSFLEKDWPARRLCRSEVITLQIARPVEASYAFLGEPANFPKWASITDGRWEQRGEHEWFAATAAGPRLVRFSKPNGYGILDHALYAAGEEPIFNPMRVVADEEGTLLTYAGWQRPGVSDEKFASTMEWIRADLMIAKTLLEA